MATLALNSFGNGSRFPVFLPFRLSPDCAMNRGTRPLSLTDGKFSLEKKEGYCTAHLVTQERFPLTQAKGKGQPWLSIENRTTINYES